KSFPRRHQNQVTLPPLAHNIHPDRTWIEEETVKGFCAAAALLAVGFLAAVPDGHAQEQLSFKTIIGKGYDIKSVTFAKGESTENREVFVVTLQKDKSVAVCYFAAVNWINLSAAQLDDSKRCDVR